MDFFRYLTLINKNNNNSNQTLDQSLLELKNILKVNSKGSNKFYSFKINMLRIIIGKCYLKKNDIPNAMKFFEQIRENLSYSKFYNINYFLLSKTISIITRSKQSRSIDIHKFKLNLLYLEKRLKSLNLTENKIKTKGHHVEEVIELIIAQKKNKFKNYHLELIKDAMKKTYVSHMSDNKIVMKAKKQLISEVNKEARKEIRRQVKKEARKKKFFEKEKQKKINSLRKKILLSYEFDLSQFTKIILEIEKNAEITERRKVQRQTESELLIKTNKKTNTSSKKIKEQKIKESLVKANRAYEERLLRFKKQEDNILSEKVNLISKIDEQIRLFPSKIGNYIIKARILANHSYISSAISTLEEVILIDSTYAEAYCMRALIYMQGRDKKITEVMDDLNISLRYNPKLTSNYCGMILKYVSGDTLKNRIAKMM